MTVQIELKLTEQLPINVSVAHTHPLKPRMRITQDSLTRLVNLHEPTHPIIGTARCIDVLG